MNIDKALFIALAASLSAAVGCSASSQDDVDAAQGAIQSGTDDFCGWHPAAESLPGSESASQLTEDLNIGGDPAYSEVMNGKDYYPSAESLCVELAYNQVEAFEPEMDWRNGTDALYAKCKTYAQLYVPFTTYSAFFTLKDASLVKESLAAKQAKLAALDAKIADKDRTHVCTTDAAKATCAAASSAVEADCESLASQLKPQFLPQLKACLQKPNATAARCVAGKEVNPTP